MGKGTFIDRVRAAKLAQQKAGEEIMRQFMADMYTLALNDTEIMGKDVLGYKRLRRVLEGAIKYHDLFHDALMLRSEADYLRAKLDERLRKIIPPEAFAPFEERYPKIEPERYEKK